MKDESTRNSPVKTLLSRTESLVRLVPFSQVKSAKANGSAALLAAGVASCSAKTDGATGMSRLAARRRAARAAAGAIGESSSIGLRGIRQAGIIVSKDSGYS